MRLHELAKANNTVVRPYMEDIFKLENCVTKKGLLRVADNGFIEYAWFTYFSKYIGQVEVSITAPKTAEAIDAYFTKYLALIVDMEQDIEEDVNKIEAMKVLLGLHGTLYIENDNVVFRFEDLGVISPFENSWYVCPNGVDNVICKTLAEAAKVMADYKASLEKKPMLLKNII